MRPTTAVPGPVRAASTAHKPCSSHDSELAPMISLNDLSRDGAHRYRRIMVNRSTVAPLSERNTSRPLRPGARCAPAPLVRCELMHSGPIVRAIGAAVVTIEQQLPELADQRVARI